MRFILLLVILLHAPVLLAQNYTAQDMTLQLDENGIATLTPEDVLVNTTGTLMGIQSNDDNFLFHYNQETQSLTLVDEFDLLCYGSIELYYAYDRNPINRRDYISETSVDVGDIFTHISNSLECDIDGAFGPIDGPDNCGFFFPPPLLFSFDREGVLYHPSSQGPNALFTFDIHSNIRTFFAENYLHKTNSGITYDFENHRLIGTTRSFSNNLTFLAIDIETATVDILFEFPPIGDCHANAIEYIGNDIMLVGSEFSSCSEIYAINLITQEITILANDYRISDFLFIEDEIPYATLSLSEFTCADLGEQIVTITVIENGIPVDYQSTVNVVSDFSVRGCRIFQSLVIPDPNGSNGELVGDYTDTIQVVSSCSSTFTITQDPVPGTLIPRGENVIITLTVTDEFGETALCQIIGCSDFNLSIEDQTLSESDFIVYPNPTTDQITIENRNNILLSSIEILDINGRLLGFKEINSEAKNISLSLSSYSSGVYFVKINTDNDFLVKQIIKQ